MRKLTLVVFQMNLEKEKHLKDKHLKDVLYLF